ncbi:MAG: putative phage tail protein [Lachnospirales bacterium]
MDLIKYLPEFMANVEDFKIISSSLQPVADTLNKSIENIGNELFAESAGEYGISRFEKVFNIEANDSESLELRRFRVITKLKGLEKCDIESKIKDITGENNYTISLDIDKLTLDVRITVQSKEYLETVKAMLDRIVPCNIILDVRLLYASHQMISSKTHEYLSGFKNEDIKLIGIEL